MPPRKSRISGPTFKLWIMQISKSAEFGIGTAKIRFQGNMLASWNRKPSTALPADGRCWWKRYPQAISYSLWSHWRGGNAYDFWISNFWLQYYRHFLNSEKRKIAYRCEVRKIEADESRADLASSEHRHGAHSHAHSPRRQHKIYRLVLSGLCLMVFGTSFSIHYIYSFIFHSSVASTWITQNMYRRLGRPAY